MLYYFRQRKNRNMAGTILVSFFFIFLLFLPIYAEEEERVIRVGYYPLDNYHVLDESGNMTGYEIEYLNKIAEKTGWKYEYIQAESWAEVVKMLENGEVDLISPAQITSKRNAKFGFSSFPIGKIYGAIVTLKSNETLYEDFDAFSDMVFGVEKGVTFYNLFREYAAENNFTPNLITYENSDALMAGLESGRVDAAIINIMRVKDDYKLLGRFGTSSCYFMFQKEDTYLEEELNLALYKIDLEFPSYQNDLVSRYFPIYSMEFITKDEMEYVETLGELTVGCPVNMDPVSYLDEDTQEIAGITRDILDLVSERTGIKFRYVPLPDTSITYDYLRENKIELITCVENNGTNANAPGLHLSAPYLNSQKVLVGKKGAIYDSDSELRVVISTGSQTLQSVIQAQYSNFKIQLYNSVEDCMEAIKRGEADILIQNQYMVESYLAKPQYEQFAIIPSAGINDRLSLSVITAQEGVGIEDPMLSDRRLISILNKGIMNVTQDEISNIIIAHTTNRPYKFKLEDFIYQYRATIIVIVLCGFIALAIGIYAFRIRQKTMALLRKSERRLINITNNINGGVVVLLPNEGFKITYANEGFLDLIKYSKEEFDDIQNCSYMMYVHKEDIPIINKILQKDFLKEKQISVRLRIRQKDGNYIPTRFNGTVSIGDHGNLEIYCVIMDISQEITMLEKLELEQKKHNLIIEKTNEIMYEIDLVKSEIHVSDTFEKMFGWTLNQKFISSDIEDLVRGWKIQEEDMPILISMFQNMIYEQQDGSCDIRIMDHEKSYRWCRITQYAMQDGKSQVYSIIGKITDIHEEMKEKLLLEKKSQIDTATGLYNKQSFLKLSKQYLERNSDVPSAVVFFDLDHFKKINDLLGHMTGDKAIIDAARKLQKIFPGEHILSRFGGDEFCALLKNISIEALEEKLNIIKEELCHTYQDLSHSVSITSSIGVAYTEDCGYDITILLECADKALYAVKENGKNNFMFYHEDIELKGYHGRQ